MLSVYILSSVCSLDYLFYIWGCVFTVGPLEHRYLREYIFTPSYYHHQIGSIRLCTFPIIVILPSFCVCDGYTLYFASYPLSPPPFPGKLGCVAIIKYCALYDVWLIILYMLTLWSYSIIFHIILSHFHHLTDWSKA